MTARASPVALTADLGEDFRGRLIETAVGACLRNGLMGTGAQLFYWSSRNRELDFLLETGDTVVAIEVKSGRRRASLRGIDAFVKKYRVKRKLLVGGDGIPLEDFLLTPPVRWLD